MYFVVFFLRFLWDVLNWKSVNYLQNHIYELESNSNTNYFYLTFFAFYLLFEGLPTSILLAIITKLISTRKPEEQPLMENFGVNSSQIQF
eukprot:m.477833 g.477833  ORF g.477833 m.477833 type:complete len:90 (-) comp57163_c0_seq28:3246-3515(-)